MRRTNILLAMGLVVSAAVAPAMAVSPGDVRLNEIQVLGTHNSYHVQARPAVFTALSAFDPALAMTLEYTHLPLADQFQSQGIRQIELDVFADPAGGLYADPAGLKLVGQSPSGAPQLEQPGFKVLHVQDIDFETRCLTLIECLQAVKAWSDAHPTHLPIMILIEAKDDAIPDPLALGFVVPLPIGPAEFDALDAEIRSVFPAEQLITPDDVRGSRPTLEKAVLTDGWPTLREARGKVLFTLDNGGTKRDDYIAGHPSLQGRVMFTDSAPGEPEAAFVKLNDPLVDGDLIAKRVARGYIVRTRADADTVQARTGDVTQRDAALASGAQFVSTDYPVPDPKFGTGYFVAIPGGATARCNPVNSPNKCPSTGLENLTGFQALSGKQLLVQDKDGDASKRKLLVMSTDQLSDVPLAGSADDPSLAGATLQLRNPTTNEVAMFNLPPGNKWKGLGKPAGSKGYQYLDAAGDAGPCKLFLLKPGKLVKALCLGKNGDIPFTLDEPTQGSLAFTLQLGAGPVYCMTFGGTVAETQATAGKVGMFKATNAAPGSCPP